MKIGIFTVQDAKAGAYLQPFYSPTVASAMRAFGDVVNERGHAFNRHPADYHLFHVGTFNDADCSFELLKAPSPLACALDVLDKGALQGQLFDGEVIGPEGPVLGGGSMSNGAARE